MRITTLITFICSVSLNCAGNMLLKIGMKNSGDLTLSNIAGLIKGIVFNPFIVGGAVSYVISLGFYMVLLKRVNLSIVYPLYVGSQLIILTALSILLLKESVTVTHITGGAAILLGIALILR